MNESLNLFMSIIQIVLIIHLSSSILLFYLIYLILNIDLHFSLMVIFPFIKFNFVNHSYLNPNVIYFAIIMDFEVAIKQDRHQAIDLNHYSNKNFTKKKISLVVPRKVELGFHSLNQ